MDLHLNTVATTRTLYEAIWNSVFHEGQSFVCDKPGDYNIAFRDFMDKYKPTGKIPSDIVVQELHMECIDIQPLPGNTDEDMDFAEQTDGEKSYTVSIEDFPVHENWCEIIVATRPVEPPKQSLTACAVNVLNQFNKGFDYAIAG